MKHLIFVVLSLALLSSLQAHPWKPEYYVIVDTDCGFDDLRALNLMLASPEIRVLAITTSNGVLDAKTGFWKVKSLLSDMHHEGLMVGASVDTMVKASGCIPAMELSWGSAVPDPLAIPTAVEVVDYVLSQTTEPVTFVSLGSLNTAFMCHRSCGQFSEKVSSILWSSQSSTVGEGFNYSLDATAFRELNRLQFPIHMVGSERDDIRYDQTMSEALATTGGPDALRIAASTMQSDNPFSGAISDELILVHMHFNDMFTSEKLSNSLMKYTVDSDVTGMDLIDAYKAILTGSTVNQHQVLSVFPLDTGAYFSDVNEGMTDAIEHFGKEEWIACVIAAEMHRHLGVYAVLGVKMGLRAREYFAAGVDEMNVLSHTGTSQPYSCLNDGIQVSTGATIGHGLISISQDSHHMVSADFTYLGQTVRVALKEEYRERVQAEISEYNRIYGLDSHIYWDLVRIAAIKYWTQWDRHDIFDIIPLSD